ncbi:hypothetical protein FRX31_002654, partial [Thalictrum thalictroides]
MIVEGKPVIHVKTEQFAHVHERNSKLVVASFVGRRPGFSYVREVLSRYWKLKKQFIMRPYGEKMFTFEFE